MKKWIFLSVFLVLSCTDGELIEGIEGIENIVVEEITTTTTLNEGLVASYSFSNNTNDSSGNELHGVLYEGGYGECRSNKEFSSLQLDVNDNPSWGERNDRVEVTYDPIMDVDHITISAWVNTQEKSSPYDDRHYSIVSRWFTDWTDENEEKGAYAFYIDGNQNLAFTDRFQFLVAKEVFIEYNVWTHITVTIDNEKLRFYVNGGFIYEEKLNIGFKLPHNSLNLFIGERRMYNGYWYHFEGKLDEVNMWGRALSPCEVLEVYNQNI
ncbi:LamG domain-containing protein [Gammaproteobacteria bacterium]|nr:LamG domain-containing protein [Gammaproteobacteria bacterium]